MMRVMRKTAAVLIVVTAVAFTAFGQEKKPLSPPAEAVGEIAGNTITIEYSAPSKRGRAIMGALVPYARVWRTGANDATTLTTEADLLIGGLLVPKGTYTVFTIPGEKEWELIINKQTGQWGTQYDDSQDLGRVKMTVKPLENTVETFVIGVKPTKGNNGVLTFSWENTEASVPFMVRLK
jgi:hypothetical protein